MLRVPERNTTLYEEITEAIGYVEPSFGRSAQQQALYQLVALGVTLLIAIVSGILTGLYFLYFCLTKNTILICTFVIYQRIVLTKR